MAHEIVFRPAIDQETDEIVAWYESQKRGLGILFLEMLNIVIHRIEQFPLQFQAIHKDVRKATVKDFPYNIYFKTTKNRIIILAILHQKRNPKMWKQRK